MMTKQAKLFSSEAVSEGHPDKICDQISDRILDDLLQHDPNARVACETIICNSQIIIAGEVTSHHNPDYDQLVRSLLKEIGYDDISKGLDYQTCDIKVLVQKQSAEIEHGVAKQGAGDQGIVFGYATNKTSNYFPLSAQLANELVARASFLRKKGSFLWARPDMKSQVTLDYTNRQKPQLHSLVMAVQHDPHYEQAEFFRFIKQEIMIPLAQKHGLNTNFHSLINAAGTFVKGGPAADTGLTGRKIIVDTYGGVSRHGGGCFSGKDPTKTDRSGAYMCRYVAKNLVAAGLVEEIEIQVSYVIGIDHPIAIYFDTFQTHQVSKKTLSDLIDRYFDFRPAVIIDHLQLKKVRYEPTATYGHFGRDELNLPWEQLDMVPFLQQYIK